MPASTPARRRSPAAGLRTFFRLAEAWQLGIAEQTTLLGVARTTLYQWKQGKVGPLDRHQLERLSHLFGIYSSLHILFPVAAPRRRMDQEAQQRAALRRQVRARPDARRPGRRPVRRSPVPRRATRRQGLGRLTARARLRVRGGRSEERAAGARVLASVVPADPVALPDRRPVRRDRRRRPTSRRCSRSRRSPIRACATRSASCSWCRREERVSGPGATPVMAAFTHLNPEGSRFSDGSYGVYYAAHSLATAVAEVSHHRGGVPAPHRRAGDRPRHAPHHRQRRGRAARPARPRPNAQPADRPYASVLDPDDYGPSQRARRGAARQGSWGISYPSVRDAEGECVGDLPAAGAAPRQVGPAHRPALGRRADHALVREARSRIPCAR